MTIGDAGELEAKIADRGFVTTMEPAAGSGAMVIALAHEMKDAGVNYQRHLHVTAVDVNSRYFSICLGLTTGTKTLINTRFQKNSQRSKDFLDH